ncbi:MAG: hypothetical protein JEZ12_28210 [Desulfobacterium sp.]|nr:hypothetical protein [Desulfobacterium sp.]
MTEKTQGRFYCKLNKCELSIKDCLHRRNIAILKMDPKTSGSARRKYGHLHVQSCFSCEQGLELYRAFGPGDASDKEARTRIKSAKKNKTKKTVAMKERVCNLPGCNEPIVKAEGMSLQSLAQCRYCAEHRAMSPTARKHDSARLKLEQQKEKEMA